MVPNNSPQLSILIVPKQKCPPLQPKSWHKRFKQEFIKDIQMVQKCLAISQSTYLNARKNMNKSNDWVQKSYQGIQSNTCQNWIKLTHTSILMNNMKGYFHSSKQLNQQQLKSCGYHNKYQIMWKMRIKRSFKGCNLA